MPAKHEAYLGIMGTPTTPQPTNKQGIDLRTRWTISTTRSSTGTTDGETGDPVLGEEGCLFPDKCVMPGPHYTADCHTAEDILLNMQENEWKGSQPTTRRGKA